MSESDTTPTAAGSTIRGALGFAAVSLAAFGVWAGAGTWLSAHLREGGFYAVLTAIFLGLSGLALHPLVTGPRSWARFNKSFIPAFLAYAVAWNASWFALGWVKGEWLGSLTGALAFALVLGVFFGSFQPFLKSALVLFIGHSAGYFLGGPVHYHFKATWSILAWGLLYGLGFGAGIGYAFHAFQQRKPQAPSV